MSHLPLDARAILHYLNELGYRNISAEQLKEFLKGMQPQSEINKKSKFRTQQQRILQQQLQTTPTTRNPTIPATPTSAGGAPAPASVEAGATAASTTTVSATTNQQDTYKRGGGPSVKVIKCKKPLCHFKFYLDICDHQLTKRIEDQIKFLGGSLEFFLTPSVTHFVTDKPINANASTHNINANSCPGTPQTPQTPQTPYSLENQDCSRGPNNGIAASGPPKKPIRNSRADAILNRARRLSTAATTTTPSVTTVATCNSRTRLSIAFDQAANTSTPLKSIDNVAPSPPYTVWACENALKFFKKVQHELKDYLKGSPKSSSQKAYSIEPISLKGGFIKIEALKRNYRPYYQLFKKPTGEWPKIELTREDGAFRLSPKKPTTTATTAIPTSPKEEKKEKCEDTATVVVANTATNQLNEVNMTRKSRSRSTQNLKKPQEDDLIKSPANSQKNSVCKNQAPQKDSTDKQCGVCEICKIEYDALTIHLKTKDHEYFAKNSQNFIALDTLIHSSADVSKFLDDNHKLELKTELEEMEVDQEELENNDEIDPLDDNVQDETAVDEESQRSHSFSKPKGAVAPRKMCSPTLREKSKRSTKGKHSSEKFKNALTGNSIAAISTHSMVNSKSSKSASPSKSSPSMLPLNVKNPGTRKKQTASVANAALSPPIRAMLPPNSLYKVETHTEVQCTPTKNRFGPGESNAMMPSPSIIVKFKKVRHTELQLLNGEAENFMFPKKISDSSDLPTDVDRHTSSDRAHNTASIGTTSPSHSSHSASPSASDEENDEDYELCSRKNTVINGKKAIAKAKRKLAPCKVVVTTTPVNLDGARYTYPKTPPPTLPSTTTATKWGDCGGRQSFPKTPIQPFEQLKKSNNKRKPAVANATINSVDIIAETAKIMFPEATRKSSRTATAIVTAATTSTRLLQAAVDAAKNKNKVQPAAITTSAKVIAKNHTKTYFPSTLLKQETVKTETFDKPKPKLSPAKKENNVIVGPASKKLRLTESQPVVNHVEDRVGENIKQKAKKSRKLKSRIGKCFKKRVVADDEKEDDVVDDEHKGKNVGNNCDAYKKENDLNYGVAEANHHDDDEEDDDDDDVTIDNDDEKDEDYVHTFKPKHVIKKVAQSASKVSCQTPKVRRKRRTTLPLLGSSSKRDERLARRQSRVIAQIKLELHTDLEREEEEQELIMTPKCERMLTMKTSKSTSKATSKSSVKLINKTPTKSPVKSPLKSPSKSPSKSSTKSPAKSSPKKIAETVSHKQSPAKQDSPPSSSSSTQKKDPAHVKKDKKSSHSSPSRLFDFTKSERLKQLRYAFERLPSSDLWYKVYQRQDNCKEKYFEYFGSTKYRKLPYEMGPIPFEMSFQDSLGKKICCKLCQNKNAVKIETEIKPKTARKDLFLDLIPQKEDNNCSSTSATATKLEHSKSINTSASDSTQQQYAHKHKKLHLLQRYRQEQQQEQQEILQRQKLEEEVQNSNSQRFCGGDSDIKTEEITQDSVRSREERAGSTQSNISSCASSAGTYSKSKIMHKKVVSKSAYLAHLELPPRKSPREHASTLALVSCIIKQRQDSMSKPNSETDEPPHTPIEEKSAELTNTNVVKDEEIAKVLARLKTPPPEHHFNQPQKTSVRESPLPQTAASVVNSPRTRSHAATPVEELRFATEISENVKRMRRGRNKYDYSPPFVARSGSARSSKNRAAINKATLALWGGGRLSPANCELKTSAPFANERSKTPTTIRNKKIKVRDIATTNKVTRTVGRPRGRRRNTVGGIKTATGIVPLVRKTGTKKGVLEFEMNSTALDGLQKVTTEYKNPKLLEWQIDKFLTRMCKAYEPTEEDFMKYANIARTCTFPPHEQNDDDEDDDGNYGDFSHSLPPTPFVPPNSVMLNTPPATDCFSSDFDLYDLIQTDLLKDSNEKSENIHSKDRKSTKFSIFNSAHMQGYYRKRKNLKSNRTGWPKVPKKKAATRQQSKSNKIYFLQNNVTKRDDNVDANIVVKQEIDQAELDDDTTQDHTRDNSVMTPPDSEAGSTSPKQTGENASEIMEGEEEDGDEGSHGVLNDVGDDEDVDGEDDNDNDNETLADSIEEDIIDHPKAVDSDADEEEEEDDEDKEHEEDEDEELEDTQDSIDCKMILKKSKRSITKMFPNNEYDEDSYEPREKRLRFLDDTSTLSPLDKTRSNNLSINVATVTSTPTTTPFMRALRRTPLLNGSVGSCISPSEKAGDNSDIFTVSSDGLDTDLDLSNSHSQLRNTCGDDDNHHHLNHHHQQHDHIPTHSGSHNSSSATTPRRKFDISKYAPTNAASCAAEAATAAVKSLAISQFLKKEVRVQCRRLRAPFRRFRYRR